jgi:integrase
MSNDEIRVSIVDYGPGRCLMMRYIDPITGKQVAKSTGTRNREKAIGKAAVWQDELTSGRYQPPCKTTWADFRERYRSEKLPALSESSQVSAEVSLDTLERVVNPDRLAKLTTAVMSQFQAKLREGGMRDTTIAHHLRQIKAALNWAARMGLMTKAPKIELPRRAKGQTFMKGRPVTTEEYERMVQAVPKVRPKDAGTWLRLLQGLWLSGLRLGEACALSWDEDAPFAVDLTGKRPCFRIHAEAQKARRDELLPMTPDLADWLLKTPESKRHGPVFPLPHCRNGSPMDRREVGRIITAIGHKAGVVVAKERKKVTEEVDGKKRKVEREVPKNASAHDLRRAFGTRWSKRVMPAVLKQLMRHADIGTTMKYYVASSAADLADELWASFGPKAEPKAAQKPAGNTLGNTTQK